MFKFFKRMFTAMLAAFRRPLPPYVPPRKTTSHAYPPSSWAADNIGQPFRFESDEPLIKLPPGYFWKQDANGSVWRIYRIPMNDRYYDNLQRRTA